LNVQPHQRKEIYPLVFPLKRNAVQTALPNEKLENRSEKLRSAHNQLTNQYPSMPPSMRRREPQLEVLLVESTL
jgi:hypothetical protein